MPQQAPNVLGVPWYSPEQYARVVSIMADPQALPATFQEWRGTVDYLQEQAKAAGIRIVRAPLDPDAFLAWCAQHGLAPDGRARTRYAREAASAESAAGINA
jgi:hypothetical protein